MTNMQATESKSHSVSMHNCHWLRSMTYMQPTESKSHSVFMHICHWLWSMTNMQATESKSHSVLHICHWLWSMTNMHGRVCRHRSKQCPLGIWSMTNMHTQCCIFVIDFGQWQICRLLSLNHTQWSMTFMHMINDKNADTCTIPSA